MEATNIRREGDQAGQDKDGPAHSNSKELWAIISLVGGAGDSPALVSRTAKRDAASVASPQAEKANRSPTNTPLKGRASRALVKAL